MVESENLQGGLLLSCLAVKICIQSVCVCVWKRVSPIDVWQLGNAVRRQSGAMQQDGNVKVHILQRDLALGRSMVLLRDGRIVLVSFVYRLFFAFVLADVLLDTVGVIYAMVSNECTMHALLTDCLRGLLVDLVLDGGSFARASKKTTHCA